MRDPKLEAIVELVSEVCETPITLNSLIDEQYLELAVQKGLTERQILILRMLSQYATTHLEHIKATQLNEKLIEKLEHSNRLASVGEMTSAIAHEIKNPLGIIQGHADLLQMTVQMGELDKDLILEINGKIQKTVQRISQIINGLRSYSKADTDSVSEVISMSDLIHESIEFSRAKFSHAAIGLQVLLPPQEVYVECRPVQISQVLVNLLNNSFDAIATREQAWLRVELLDNADTVCLAVTDSGPGISPEIRAKLMQPFFTTKGNNKGTGLGLNVSRKILKAHGGTIELDEQSKNTRFVIRLPKKQTELSRAVGET